MTFNEWYENLTADCPTWKTSLAMESARVVWNAAGAAERERWEAEATAVIALIEAHQHQAALRTLVDAIARA